MVTYKVWMEIEECDDENNHYEDASAFPVCLGQFNSIEDADAAIVKITGQSSLDSFKSNIV